MFCVGPIKTLHRATTSAHFADFVRPNATSFKLIRRSSLYITTYTLQGLVVYANLTARWTFFSHYVVTLFTLGQFCLVFHHRSVTSPDNVLVFNFYFCDGKQKSCQSPKKIKGTISVQLLTIRTI